MAVTEGPQRAPHRAMLRATGLGDEDLRRPLIGVASSWNEVTPCNLHLHGLAQHVKEGIRAAGATPIEFTTIAVSDGIAMGHEGMKASLVSREVIADSVELMVLAEAFDGLQRDLGRELGAMAEVEDRVTFAEFPVLRHVTPCLPHEPDGSDVGALPTARVKKSQLPGPRER